jgi:hypothetical protein
MIRTDKEINDFINNDMKDDRSFVFKHFRDKVKGDMATITDDITLVSSVAYRLAHIMGTISFLNNDLSILNNLVAYIYKEAMSEFMRFSDVDSILQGVVKKHVGNSNAAPDRETMFKILKETDEEIAKIEAEAGKRK